MQGAVSAERDKDIAVAVRRYSFRMRLGVALPAGQKYFVFLARTVEYTPYYVKLFGALARYVLFVSNKINHFFHSLSVFLTA